MIYCTLNYKVVVFEIISGVFFCVLRLSRPHLFRVRFFILVFSEKFMITVRGVFRFGEVSYNGRHTA